MLVSEVLKQARVSERNLEKAYQTIQEDLSDSKSTLKIIGVKGMFNKSHILKVNKDRLVGMDLELEGDTTSLIDSLRGSYARKTSTVPGVKSELGQAIDALNELTDKNTKQELLEAAKKAYTLYQARVNKLKGSRSKAS